MREDTHAPLGSCGAERSCLVTATLAAKAPLVGVFLMSNNSSQRAPLREDGKVAAGIPCSLNHGELTDHCPPPQLPQKEHVEASSWLLDASELPSKTPRG